MFNPYVVQSILIIVDHNKISMGSNCFGIDLRLRSKLLSDCESGDVDMGVDDGYNLNT